MNSLTREERLRVLELAAEIASEATRNTNVVWMLEFQEELVERLYRKMSALLEEPREVRSRKAAGDEPAAAEAATQERAAEPAAARPRKSSARRKAPSKSR
jgi:hypothetical protein